jgi:molybdenum cofactor guanylyltransferase
MTGRRLTAVILAGGRSSRFGRDKLVEPLDGRPLIQHAIDAVRPLAAEMLVVGAPAATSGAASPLPDDIALVHDPVAFEGPLVGLLAGLGAASGPIILVVGGDMPSLLGTVLESMVSELEGSAVEAVVLEHAGRARSLPMVLRREPGLAAARRLIDEGERRLGALAESLAAHVIPEASWRALDPEGRTIRDIDTAADLR